MGLIRQLSNKRYFKINLKIFRGVFLMKQRRKTDTAISKALKSVCIALIKLLKTTGKMSLFLVTSL